MYTFYKKCERCLFSTKEKIARYIILNVKKKK